MTPATVDVLSTQITLSGLSVLLLQKLKSSSWATWFTSKSDTVNRVANVTLGILAAIGIHLTWNHGALPGTYMMEVSGVTFTGIALGIWAVLKSVVLNEIIYRGTAKSQQTQQTGQANILGLTEKKQ